MFASQETCPRRRSRVRVVRTCRRAVVIHWEMEFGEYRLNNFAMSPECVRRLLVVSAASAFKLRRWGNFADARLIS